MENNIKEMRAALEAVVKAGELLQKGERNGYAMGAISTATDLARAALAFDNLRGIKDPVPVSIFDALKGRRVRVTGGKKYPVGLEGVIAYVEARGYNDMVHFKTDNGEEFESASYNIGVID